jgi:hypothetical protein
VASPSPTIAVQKVHGKPKLELPEGAGGATAPGPSPAAPAQPLPPPPAAAAPVFGPEGEPPQTRRPWTPDEAGLAAAGAHNVGWSGALFVRKELTERELLEAAYADPKELDAAAPSIARVLDKTPLQPGGSGTLGLLGDLLVTAQAFVQLEVRHASRVEAARKRLKEKGQEPGARAGSAPAPPRKERPSTPPPARDMEPEGDGSFRFNPAELQVLGEHP